MRLLYDAGIGLYSVGARIAGLRSEKARRFCEGRKDALENLERLTEEKAPEGYDYWFHAASLGEFEQARPIIETIRCQTPDVRILLTFFSPSGYEVRQDYPLVTAVAYLPPDTRGKVSRFLDIARPEKAVFIKYEFWLNFLHELRERSIPTYLVSAIFRKNQIFFRPWGGMFRSGLKCFTRIFVQDEDSKKLLESIGNDRVTVAGDTRFDRVNDIRQKGREFPVIAQWCKDCFTVIAGSSWQQDEMRYIPWINDHPNCKAIIAPHEFDDHRLELLRMTLTGRSMLWSEIKDDEPIPDDVATIIVDTFGLLSSLYRYADVVLIGGGFGAGIHNINEAAVWGVPIMIGPRHSKFKEAADLLSSGGAFEYRTSEEAALIMTEMKNEPEKKDRAATTAARYISSNLGATDTILKEIL